MNRCSKRDEKGNTLVPSFDYIQALFKTQGVHTGEFEVLLSPPIEVLFRPHTVFPFHASFRRPTLPTLRYRADNLLARFNPEPLGSL
jgi:hypothetical protein